MIQELSTTEFIAGIANDIYDENDIVKYCSALYNIKAFYGALMVEHSRMINSHNVPTVTFAKDGTLHTDGSDTLTPESKTKLERVANAILVVEDLMQERAEQRSKLDLTEEQQTAFQKAIDAKFMEQTESGYKWLYGGNRCKIRLAYFITQIFYNPIPYKALGAMFCVTRLDSAIQQALNITTPKTENARKWKAAIDNVLS